MQTNSKSSELGRLNIIDIEWNARRLRSECQGEAMQAFGGLIAHAFDGLWPSKGAGTGGAPIGSGPAGATPSFG